MPLEQVIAFETLDWVQEKINEALRKHEKTTPGR